MTTRRTAVLAVTLALGLLACSALTGRPFVENAWSALPTAAATARPVPAPLADRVVRLEGNRAFDRAGRHVATVYAVPMNELAHASTERFGAARPVDHVTIHAMAADTHVPTPHYLVVLWHVPTPRR